MMRDRRNSLGLSDGVNGAPYLSLGSKPLDSGLVRLTCSEHLPWFAMPEGYMLYQWNMGGCGRSSNFKIVENNMNAVVHFEMPYDSRDRVTKFYESAFGWQMQKMGEEMGNYVLAITTESDPAGPKKPGAINGGFFEKKPDWPMQQPSVVIAVDDIKQAIKKVANAGGAVLGEPMDIPGVGQYVSFTDSEGNRVGMLQPAPREAPKPEQQRKAGASGLKKPGQKRSPGHSAKRGK